MGIGVCCAAVSIGAGEPKGPGPAGPSSVAKTLSERAERKFQKARFLKPRKLDPAQMEHEFAPLIVEEVREPEKESASKPGEKATTEKAILEDTVFFLPGQVRAKNQLLDQVDYVWLYKHTHEEANDNASKLPILRGVRVILWTDGTPVLWQALGADKKAAVFFAARSLEAAAEKELGVPLPGRTFSLERSIDESPRVVIAGLIDDGPVPMGPYVYLDDSPERNITVIHCRCSPSQFDEAVKTLEYDLRPLDNIDPALRDQYSIDFKKLEYPPLETLFRWPKLEP